MRSNGQSDRVRDRRPRAATFVLAFVLAAVCVAGATAAGGATPVGQIYKAAGKWGKIGTTGNGVFASTVRGIAVDRHGSVFVADTDNNRIQVFTAKGGFLRKWGSIGGADGQFSGAEDVAVGPDGSVWVADRGNGRVQLFTSNGGFTAAYPTPSGEGPQGVAIEADGNLLVAVEGGTTSGFRRYSKADSFGAPGALMGSLPGFRADDIEVSPDGTVYLVRAATQKSDERLQRFTADGKLLGSVKLASGDGTRGLGVDLDCNVWAADTSNRQIVKYSSSLKRLATATVPDLVANDIAVGPSGEVYAVHQSAGIVRFSPDRSKSRTAVVGSSVTLSGGVAKVKFTLSGVSCPAQIDATASLSGSVNGKASVKVAAGKATTLSIPVKGRSGKAQFKIVLKTNGRPTTQVASVNVTK